MTLANGHANGAVPSALAPFIPPQAGPALRWPQPEPEPDSVVTAGTAEAGRSAPDGDTVIRYLTAAVVLAVAAFAAVVSYSHIFDLGHLHGQDGTAARLLPLSVDGLIAAASLVMLHAARNRLDVPLLARVMLALGVGATVAANVAYGLPFGWLSAVVSAWPAAAFVGSVEMAIRFVSDARSVATADTAGGHDDDSGSDTERDSDTAPPDDDDTDDDSDTPPDDDKTGDPPPPPPPPPPPLDPPKDRKQPTGRDRALAIMKRNPGLSDAEVAQRANVSVRTVQRARS